MKEREHTMYALNLVNHKLDNHRDDYVMVHHMDNLVLTYTSLDICINCKAYRIIALSYQPRYLVTNDIKEREHIAMLSLCNYLRLLIWMCFTAWS